MAPASRGVLDPDRPQRGAVGEFGDALQRARKELARTPLRQDALEPEGQASFEEGFDSAAAEDAAGELAPWLLAPPRLEPSSDTLPPHGGPGVKIPLRRDRKGRWRSRSVLVDQGGPLADSFRKIAVRLRAELERRSARSVAIVSPLRGEGKTTLACNLALALASLSRGREIALVDLDLRAPSVADALGVRGPVGIESVLEGAADLEKICVSIEKPRLDVYPARESCEAAHELLVLASAERLIRELERRYAVVVFDTPPVLLLPDAALILRHVSAYAAVARAGASRVGAVRSMLDQLPAAKLVGGVLNAGALPRHASLYGYYATPRHGPKRE